MYIPTCSKALKPSIKKTRTRFRHEPPPMSSSRCASCLASPGARCINNCIHQNSIPWPWHDFTCSVVFSLTVAPLGLQRQSREISEFMWWQESTNLLGTVQHAHLTIARTWPSVDMFFWVQNNADRYGPDWIQTGSRSSLDSFLAFYKHFLDCLRGNERGKMKRVI